MKTFRQMRISKLAEIHRAKAGKTFHRSGKHARRAPLRESVPPSYAPRRRRSDGREVAADKKAKKVLPWIATYVKIDTVKPRRGGSKR